MALPPRDWARPGAVPMLDGPSWRRRSVFQRRQRKRAAAGHAKKRGFRQAKRAPHGRLACRLGRLRGRDMPRRLPVGEENVTDVLGRRSTNVAGRRGGRWALRPERSQ